MKEKSKSSVLMSLTSSSGSWLNGCLQPQHYFVSLEINDPNDKIVARVALSFEQAARMLLYNGTVECTLERYRDSNGNLVTEDVERPETVHERMKNRLNETHNSLAKRLEDVRRDVYEMLNSGKVGKSNLSELLNEIETIQSHYASNENFVVQQAEEELGSIQNNAAGQLGVFLQSHGANLKQEELLQLIPTGTSPLAITKKIEPAKDDYVMKIRPPKSIDDMNAREIADSIQKVFRKFESQQDENEKHHRLFKPNAFSKGNKTIIKYISYQGESILQLDEAKTYLKFLMSINHVDQFKRHK